MSTSAQLKILDLVVLVVIVDVMHGLLLRERPAQMLSHDEAMLQDVACLVPHRRHRMFGRDPDENVPVPCHGPATFPAPVALTPNPERGAPPEPSKEPPNCVGAQANLFSYGLERKALLTKGQDPLLKPRAALDRADCAAMSQHHPIPHQGVGNCAVVAPSLASQLHSARTSFVISDELTGGILIEDGVGHIPKVTSGYRKVK